MNKKIKGLFEKLKGTKTTKASKTIFALERFKKKKGKRKRKHKRLARPGE